MRKMTTALVAAGSVLLGGCLVTSVCPYYTQKDLVSEPGIAGTWTNEKNNEELWNFHPKGDKAFQLTITEERKADVMMARPFKLEGQLFLDIVSVEQDIHVIPAHYLVRVQQIRPLLRLSELNHEWVRSWLEKEPAALRHHLVPFGKEQESRVVLTGTTSELQSFVLRYLNTPAAWNPNLELRPTTPTNLLAGAQSY